MDPFSASVATVGFAASIASLAAVAVDSARTLQDLYRSLKEAPREIQRLEQKSKRLHSIILEVQQLSQQLHNDQPPAFIQDFWQQHVGEIQDDFATFKEKVGKLLLGLRGKSRTGKHVLIRVQKFFCEREILKCEERLSDHAQTIGILLNMLSHAHSQLIITQLRVHSKQLDILTSSCRIPGAPSEDMKTSSYSQPSQLSELVRNELYRVCNGRGTAEEQSIFGHIYNASNISGSLSIGNEKGEVQDNVFQIPFGLDCKDGKVLNMPYFDSESQVRILRQPVGPFNSLRRLLPPTSRKSVSWNISVYHFPIGTLTVERTAKLRGQQDETTASSQDRDYYIQFSLYPPQWLAKRAIKISLSLSGESMAPGYTIKPEHYNSEPALLPALQSGNIEALRDLFSKGIARPTDIIAPWGNSLLHEAILNQSSGQQNSLELVEFLIGQGADPNVRSGTGNTPLLLSCHLMRTTYQLQAEFQSLTNALIRAGGDLTICNAGGYSSCSLIFDSYQGTQYLESSVCPYIDLFTFQQMNSVDSWLLAAVARSYPTFQIVLESQLRDWRTPKEICSSQVPREEKIMNFDISYQITQLRKAPAQLRTAFFQVLCKRGNISMLTPFLDCGMDLDERWGDSSPYLREAIMAGNMSVAMALLESGASIHIQNSIDLRLGSIMVTTPIVALLYRWKCIEKQESNFEFRDGSVESEAWLLKEMLNHPTFHDPDALSVALEYSSPEMVVRALLNVGCGRVGDTKPESWRQTFHGSEIIIAVRFESPYLPLLLSHGLGLEYEDRAGFTALLHALDCPRKNGSINFAKSLIDAGANLVRRTSSGYTPLELARENLHMPHPRHKVDYGNLGIRKIGLEEDQEIYDYLLRAVRERRVSFGVVVANWTRTTINSLPGLWRDLQASYLQRIQRLSILDMLLAGLGLILTVFILLLITLWHLAWTILWKIISFRKFPRSCLGFACLVIALALTKCSMSMESAYRNVFI